MCGADESPRHHSDAKTTAELPDVKVTVADGVLRIQGESQSRAEKYHPGAEGQKDTLAVFDWAPNVDILETLEE